jgi:protein TonB
MLETLLESKSTRERSAAGAIVSVMAHTALIAAAVYATAQAHVQRTESPETIHPIYFPPSSPTVSVPRAATDGRQATVPRPIMFVPHTIEVITTPIDISGLPSKPGDFITGPSTISAPISGVEAGSSGNTPFRADQVEKQVSLVPGSEAPRYPEVLKNSGVEGRVIAEFVVDERGRAEDASVRFVRSDNRLFDDAVRTALRRMRFVPAEVGGRKVKQLVQMPFVFTISR